LRNRWQNRTLRKLHLEHQRRATQRNYFRSSPRNVLFLCYGNICRSPFAEHLWNAKIRQRLPEAPIARSAGFHPLSNRRPPAWALKLAAERGVDLSEHRSAVVTKSMVDSADVIFLMDQRNYRDLMRRFPSARSKTYFLGLFADNGFVEIRDPFSRTKAEARVCYEHVAEAMEGLMRRVVAEQKESACPRVSREARQPG
jgi:protein-tyrosine phosphatase